MGLLVLFNALLDVLPLLPQLQLLAVVLYDVDHAIHNGLNFTTTLRNCILAILLFLKKIGRAHV